MHAFVSRVTQFFSPPHLVSRFMPSLGDLTSLPSPPPLPLPLFRWWVQCRQALWPAPHPPPCFPYRSPPPPPLFAPAPLQVVGPGCRAEAERAASGNGSGKRGPDLRAWETNAVPVGADSSPLCRSTQYDSYLPSRSTFPSAHTHLPSSLRPQTCHFTLPPAPPTLPLLLGATDCR